jgi:hypothetical protein
MKGCARRTGLFFALALMVLAGILLLAAYGYSKKGRFAMAGDYKGAGLHAERPRIDKAVPERVETATFALG